MRARAAQACVLAAWVAAAPRGAIADEPQALVRAPIILAGYSLAGELAEPEPALRAVLDTVLKVGQPLPDDVERSLRSLGEVLRYRITVKRIATASGTRLGLDLAPVVSVRFVQAVGSIWPLFKDEITRRVDLRPGSVLAADPGERRAQLAREEQRVLDFLHRRGYFEAWVTATAEDLGHHEAKVRVHVQKGPVYKVGTVKIVGNTTIPDEEIRAKVIHRTPFQRLVGMVGLGSPGFSSDRLKGDLERIRALYRAAGHPGVRVRSDYDPNRSPDRERKAVDFTITINERKKIDVAFEGNHHVPADELEEALTFDDESAYDEWEVERSEEAIRRLYQGRGYFQAVVASERVHLLPTFDRIVFYLDEGPQLRVKQIQVVGNHALPATLIRSVIQTREHPGAMQFIVSGGYVTTTQLEQDVAAITDLYLRHGFAQAKVEASVATDPMLLDDMGALAAAVTADVRGEGLYVRFAIDEGPSRVVGSVQFVGNRAPINDADLAATTTLTPGVAFTEEQMAADAEAVVRFYRERGYAYAHDEVEARSAPSGQVQVIHRISEGRLVRVGKILIRGNFKTSDWVVRDALGIREGDAFAIGKLELGQQNLRYTDLFASVRPAFVGLDADSAAAREGAPVHLVVDVAERHDNLGELEFGGGFSTDNDWFVNSSYALRNIGGIGASLLVAGEAGLRIQRATSNVGLPMWIMRRVAGIPMRLDLAGRWRRDSSDKRFGNLVTWGGSASLSRQIGSGVHASLKYDYSRYGRVEELVRPAGSLEDRETIPVTTVTASLGPAIVVDRRRDASGLPNPLAPAQGYLFSSGFSLASYLLGGTDDFLKLSAHGQVFYPLGRRIVVSNGLRWDYGVPLGSSVLLPDVERFTAGGDTTVRGLEEDHVHTEIISDPLPPVGAVESFRVEPAGGNIRVIHNLDVQVTLARLAGFPLASAIFLDSGLVTNSFDGFALDRPRHGVGVALVRWITPVGSASLEYALPVDPAPGDDPTGRLHFNFGFLF